MDIKQKIREINLLIAAYTQSMQTAVGNDYKILLRKRDAAERNLELIQGRQILC